MDNTAQQNEIYQTLVPRESFNNQNSLVLINNSMWYYMCTTVFLTVFSSYFNYLKKLIDTNNFQKKNQNFKPQ